MLIGKKAGFLLLGTLLVVCVLSKTYHVHRVELSEDYNLDSTIAQLKASENNAIDSLHTPQLATLEDHGVNVGDVHLHKWNDERVRLGQQNPSVFVQAGRTSPEEHVEVKRTAKPPAMKSKLDRLGVNTGSFRWDSDLADGKHREKTYSAGLPTPHMRENVYGLFGARGGKKFPVQTLHDAWRFPEHKPYLDREGGVHTGEEKVRWNDVGIRVGEENPSHMIRAGRDPAPEPGPEATAEPPHPESKLDYLGVNTGAQHVIWDDGMRNTNGMEDSYSFGSTPVREEKSPLASVGLLASVPSKLYKKKVAPVQHAAPQAFKDANADAFFKRAVMPHLQAQHQAARMAASDLISAVQKQREEAAVRESVYKRKVAQAEAAEQSAEKEQKMAEIVGSDKLAVQIARKQEQLARVKFQKQLENNNKELSELGALPVKTSQAMQYKVAPGVSTAQARLDRAVEEDRDENKKLSSDQDVIDVMGAINALPQPKVKHSTIHGDNKAHGADKKSSKLAEVDKAQAKKASSTWSLCQIDLFKLTVCGGSA